MSSDIQSTFEHLLRGAAKALGCDSAVLLSIDEEKEQIFIRVGAYRPNFPLLARVEQSFKDVVSGIAVPIAMGADSLVMKAFRTREIQETSSLPLLLGSGFPQPFVASLSEMVGTRRFICVPVLGGERMTGVALFEKEDPHPFGVTQRELMLRYARKIGQIVEMEAAAEPREPGRTSFMLDGNQIRLMLADASPALFLDGEMRISLASNMVEPLLGFRPGELVGRHVRCLLAQPDLVEELMARHAAPDDYMAEEAIQLTHRDGHTVKASALILSMVDEMGKPEGCVLVLRQPDRFTRREHDFARMLRKERLAAMGEIASQLAHEIRNPLVSIGATVDLLRHENAGDEETRSSLDIIARELARVDGIIRDYLSLAARYRIVVGEVGVKGLIAEAVKVARLHRAAEGREIAFDAPEGLTARMDYNGMKQVLLNLLINALEASEPGGRVVCSAGAAGGTLRVAVEDDGQGLPADGADLFEPFYTTKEHGTGLGLTVCRRIVEAHGGSIALAGRAGGGCRAEVTLPRQQPGTGEHAGG